MTVPKLLLKRWVCFLAGIGFLVTLAAAAAEKQEGIFIYDAKGKKDPFSPAMMEAKKPAEIVVAGKLAELQKIEVQGILWDAKNPMAIVNDEILQVGQEFQGAKVVEIRKRELVLEYQGERVTLVVKEEEERPPAEPKGKKEIKSKKERGK